MISHDIPMVSIYSTDIPCKIAIPARRRHFASPFRVLLLGEALPSAAAALSIPSRPGEGRAVRLSPDS